MEYRKLGRSGLIVSAFALGTMQFGQGMNMGSLDQSATNAMVKFALEQGINFIDTADVYSKGESESLLGVALEGVREEVVLASKFRLPMSDTDFNRSGATRANILRGVESSLKRLKTDYLDLFQVHGWDSNTPLEETLTTLDDLVRRGMVRYIGLSNYMAWQAATALGVQERRGLEPFVTAQMYYSLVGRDLEFEWMDLRPTRAWAYSSGVRWLEATCPVSIKSPRVPHKAPAFPRRASSFPSTGSAANGCWVRCGPWPSGTG